MMYEDYEIDKKTPKKKWINLIAIFMFGSFAVFGLWDGVSIKLFDDEVLNIIVSIPMGVIYILIISNSLIAYRKGGNWIKTIEIKDDSIQLMNVYGKKFEILFSDLIIISKSVHNFLEQYIFFKDKPGGLDVHYGDEKHFFIATSMEGFNEIKEKLSLIINKEGYVLR